MRGQEDVGGIEIAVDDPVAVERVESREDGQRDRQGVGGRKRAAGQALGQRLPLQQLHGEEQLVPLLAKLVQLADGRMVDPRGRARLALQAFARRGVRRLRPQRLDRDRAVEPLVVRRVDDTHAPFTQDAGDPVTADRRAPGGLRHGRSVLCRRAGFQPVPHALVSAAASVQLLEQGPQRCLLRRAQATQPGAKGVREQRQAAGHGLA